MIHSIQKIQVDKLFGHYNYTIETNSSVDKYAPLIIYGDNGSGKTTLLEILFYLISTVDNAGHKSKIARIKFERFSIYLKDDVEITAKRSGGNLLGSYTILVKVGQNYSNEVFLEADNNFRISLSENEKTESKYLEILHIIKELNISVHYLSDKRKLFAGTNTFLSTNPTIKNLLLSRRDYELSLLQGNVLPEEENALVLSVKTLEHWIKKHVLQGSKQGDQTTNSIYSDLIKRISKQTSKSITKKDLLKLVRKLSTIRFESESYGNYGLISKIETKDIESSLDSTDKYSFDIVYNILVPYIDGLNSRLHSLSDVKNIVDLFVGSVNDYFSNKYIKYHLSKGFEIYDKEFQEPIDLDMLSSGETQLLLLFCNVITATDDASIFIIDEPEISLNIKWQRKLISTLIHFSQNKNVQFIFASHSIELLSGHKDSVCKLQHSRVE